MSYTINLTNGNVLCTIPDGTINTSACSQVLIGKNYAGYGQFLDDNFVHLLENYANPTAPTTPLTGQLWYNTTTGILQVWNGTAYRPLAVSTASTSAPTVANVGDLWYNTSLQQLNVCSATTPSITWLLVGPIYNSSTGLTGVIPGQIVDNTSISHVVANVYVNNNLLGIFSSTYPAYTPQTTIGGFANINPGLQLSTSAANASALFQGTATAAQTLSGITAGQFMRSDTSTSCVGTISVNSSASPIAIINSAGNGVGNIGSSTGYFNRIFAQATTALYADVAERFAADDIYEAGTVVELGGTAEITQSNTELSDSVFGVISTQAAYLMNGGAGSDETHPPVAMTGRVPVRAIGVVRKGDRLVSAGNGVARAAQPGEATAFNVIGRALVEKLDTGLGTVEAIVATK